MKCPIAWSEDYDGEDKIILPRADCLKEECAWWDSERSKCALLTLTRQLENLSMIAEDIRDKMPHEEQFRK